MESQQISSDNITMYRTIAMTMVVFYHCTCGYLLIRRGRDLLYKDGVFWLSLMATAAILFILTPRILFVDKISREYASMIVIIALTLVPNILVSGKICSIK